MEIYIKFTNGRIEFQKCTSYKVTDTGLLKLTVDETVEKDGHMLGRTYYYPLYDIQQFIPSEDKYSTTSVIN